MSKKIVFATTPACLESSPGIMVMARTNGVSDSRAGWTPPLPSQKGCRPRSTLYSYLCIAWRSPQLHLVPPPEGIVLGHTRESRPGSQCGCDNAAKWKAAELSFETPPSSLTAALRGGKHRSISKSRIWRFVSLVKLARGINTEKTPSRIATNLASRLQSLRKWKGPGMFKFKDLFHVRLW